jgi:hypothetical protein
MAQICTTHRYNLPGQADYQTSAPADDCLVQLLYRTINSWYKQDFLVHSTESIVCRILSTGRLISVAFKTLKPVSYSSHDGVHLKFKKKNW